MFIRSIKQFIRKYPGYVILFTGAQLALSVVFLAVIWYHARTLQLFRASAENRAEAVFVSELVQMERAIGDEALTEDGKRLVLYGKTQSAVGALCGTGYSERIKSRVTEVLNGISQHILESGGTEVLLSEEELTFLRLLEEGDGEGAYRMAADGKKGLRAWNESEEKTRIQETFFENKREVWAAANRLFGVRGILSESRTSRGGTVLYSCKNAYAVMVTEENYPLEAAICLPVGEEVYTTAECVVLARSFLEDVYPRKIYRKLSEVSERDGGSYAEVVFSGGDRSVAVRISKSSGRMILLQTMGFDNA